MYIRVKLIKKNRCPITRVMYLFCGLPFPPKLMSLAFTETEIPEFTMLSFASNHLKCHSAIFTQKERKGIAKIKFTQSKTTEIKPGMISLKKKYSIVKHDVKFVLK